MNVVIGVGFLIATGLTCWWAFRPERDADLREVRDRDRARDVMRRWTDEP